MEEQVTCSLPGQHSAGPGKTKKSLVAGASCVIAILFILAAVNAYAADDQADQYSPDKILSFTEYLIEKGEYFRAWTELRRLESYYPGYISSEKFDVTALYLMYKGKRYDEIIHSTAGKETGCAAGSPQGVIIADSLILLGDYSSARLEIEKYSASCADSMLCDAWSRRKAYISLVTGEIYSDGTAALKPELSGYRELVEYRNRMHDALKSPALAALLGIVPGCGYIYAGDEGTGFVAMTVIGVFGAVTYGSYQNGIEPLAIIAGAVTLFFYGGNIAGGYIEAKKYNGTIDNVIEKKSRNALGLDEDIDRIYIRFGISSNGK